MGFSLCSECDIKADEKLETPSVKRTPPATNYRIAQSDDIII